jgi:DNA-binding transcriptional LysR family regulator
MIGFQYFSGALADDDAAVKLTAAGHTFLREANDILNRVARSRVEARCPVQGGTGTLSIGYVVAASLFLPE